MTQKRGPMLTALLLSAAVLAGVLAGCGNAPQPVPDRDEASDRLSVVCTTFPEYDWVKSITGDKSLRHAEQSGRAEAGAELRKGPDEWLY